MAEEALISPSGLPNSGASSGGVGGLTQSFNLPVLEGVGCL